MHSAPLFCYARHMAPSDQRLLDSLSRVPFIDSAELSRVLGEPHATVHRALSDLLADGIVGRANHGTAQLPSSQRYHLTAQGIREAAGILGFATPSDFVRAYPVSREWLTLLIRRMDAVAAVYRLAASMSPGIDGLRSRVEFHRRGRFDATITLHDGRSFGVVRPGPGPAAPVSLRRLRAIAEYDYTRRPGTILILVPSVWEERLTTRFCERLNLDDCYVAVESRDALERRDLRLWHKYSWVGSSYRTLEYVSSHGSPGGRRSTASPERKRASLPRPERMARAAPAFGLSPSEKRTLTLITDHPMIPREHLATWLGVSEGRVSQMMRSLVDTWGLIERRGKRRDVRYTLSSEDIRYVTHRDRAQLPTTQGIWSAALTTDKQGRRRHVGHRIETWARQTRHADGITWFLSQLQAEARDDPDSDLLWSVPTARSEPHLQLGRFRHRTRRNWADDRPGPSDTVLLRARTPRPPSQGSHSPPQTVHALLPFQRAGGRPAAVPRHPVRRGHRGGRGHLRAHRRPLEPDVAAHLRVVHTRSVTHGNTRTVMASTVGTGVSPTAPVRTESLPVGLALPPDAPSSCREG